jgi:hypothetical protein
VSYPTYKEAQTLIQCGGKLQEMKDGGRCAKSGHVLNTEQIKIKFENTSKNYRG